MTDNTGEYISFGEDGKSYKKETIYVDKVIEIIKQYFGGGMCPIEPIHEDGSEE